MWMEAIRYAFKEEAEPKLCLARHGGSKLGCEKASNAQQSGVGNGSCCTTKGQEPSGGELGTHKWRKMGKSDWLKL